MRWADDRQLFGGGMFVETPGLAHTRGKALQPTRVRRIAPYFH